MQAVINPFYNSASVPTQQAPANSSKPVYARLPAAPITGSPVPHLTSLYHFDRAGEYGSRKYPGNCGGNLIRDLLTFFNAKAVFDPMTGSGTCRDVCKDMGIYCWSSDLHMGEDACVPTPATRGCFDFCWIHPPYWRQKLYTEDQRDLSRAPTLAAFLERYRLLLANCADSLVQGGKLAVLMGDYRDRQAGLVPLVYHSKRLAFATGLRQCTTDIIRFSHGASSGKKVYRSAFIPGLHDVCMLFEKAGPKGGAHE
jgi:hypothetical protein